jgi:hypothetical protein
MHHYAIDAVPLVMMYFVDSSSITTENLILTVVGSVGVLAVVIAISVCVAYDYSAKKR